MNKIILILALFTMPFMSFGQTEIDKAPLVINTEVVKEVILNETNLVLRKVEPISANPKIQNKTINFNKSNDIISVKAYMKSLHLKRKLTIMS